MKVAIECDSMLLQVSLEIFLRDFQSNLDESDFLITDKLLRSDKPLLFISNSSNQAYLKKPFSKSRLLVAVEKFYNENVKNKDKQDKLKSQMQELTNDFVEKLMVVVKEYYER